MLTSTHQRLVCVLVILCAFGSAHAQNAPAKEPGSVVSGKVTIKGKAAPGIVVSLRSNPRNMGPVSPRVASYKAVTNDDGEYRIANVAAGTYVVVPLARALVTAEASDEPRTLIVGKSETIEHIDIALVRGGAITGKVVDADGRPLVELDVQIFPSPSNNRSYPTARAQTDDRGIYRVYGLRAGGYKVAAGQDEGSYGSYRPAVYKRTYHPSVTDVDQATVIELSEGGEATNVDITLGRSLNTYAATGRIVESETGQPVANASYGVTHFVTPNNRWSSANGSVTNSRGEFKLDNLVPGKYAIFVSPAGNSNWRAEEVPFEIVDDDVNGIVVQARKGATVSGVVVVEGTDDKNVREELRHMMVSGYVPQREQFGSSSSALIAPDGTFSIPGAPAGTLLFNIGNSSRFRVMRVERNGVVQPVRGVEVKEGENVTGVKIVMVYGNAIIRGSLEVTGGTLPAGSRFFVWLREVSEDPMSAANVFVNLDSRGQFVSDGLQAGTYEVNAGVANPETRMTIGMKRQQVVVTAGSVNNVSLSIDLNSVPPRP